MASHNRSRKLKTQNEISTLRLDKWLWAARFFKNRKLSKVAILRGKIRIGGIKPKPARMIKIDDKIEIKRGWEIKTIIVLSINKQRRSATEAQQLYKETAQSIQIRQEKQALHRLNTTHIQTTGKPTKKERRQVVGFKRQYC